MGKIFNSKIYRIFMLIFKIIFFSILIIYLSFMIVQKVSEKHSVFGVHLYEISTSFITDSYQINDIVILDDTNNDNLKVGDMIIYKGVNGALENRLVLHKIDKIDVKDDTKTFITKGVNSEVYDPAIEEKQIIGKVVGVLPVITTLNHLLKNSVMLFFLVFCPLFLMIILDIIKTICDIRREGKLERKFVFTAKIIRSFGANEKEGKDVPVIQRVFDYVEFDEPIVHKIEVIEDKKVKTKDKKEEVKKDKEEPVIHKVEIIKDKKEDKKEEKKKDQVVKKKKETTKKEKEKKDEPVIYKIEIIEDKKEEKKKEKDTKTKKEPNKKEKTVKKKKEEKEIEILD